MYRFPIYWSVLKQSWLYSHIESDEGMLTVLYSTYDILTAFYDYLFNEMDSDLLMT